MTAVFDDHLTLDAIVAFADGEMALTPYQRAAAHLVRCAVCAADVDEQTAAANYLRSASLPRMPGSLFDALRSIPLALPQGTAPEAENDQLSSGRGRRFRIGAGALMAGLAVGAVMAAASGDQPTVPNRLVHPDPSAVSRPSGLLHPTVVDVVARRTGTR